MSRMKKYTMIAVSVLYHGMGSERYGRLTSTLSATKGQSGMEQSINLMLKNAHSANVKNCTAPARGVDHGQMVMDN